MRMEKDFAMLGFEMKLSQRNLLHKVEFDALGNVNRLSQHQILYQNRLRSRP